MIWLISDTHFAHKNILTYEARPFVDLLDMREQLIANWNKVVSPDDIVIHLGDFGFCNKETTKSIIDRLNGHKILILGNHDCHSSTWYLDCGFEEVLRNKLLIYNGLNILLTHHPISIPEQYKGQYNLHLYGHVHGKGNENGKYPTIAKNGACLCVERWDYTPVKLDYIIEQCSKSENLFCENKDLIGFN